jgi:hypothetical protein
MSDLKVRPARENSRFLAAPGMTFVVWEMSQNLGELTASRFGDKHKVVRSKINRHRLKPVVPARAGIKASATLRRKNKNPTRVKVARGARGGVLRAEAQFFAKIQCRT